MFNPNDKDCNETCEYAKAIKELRGKEYNVYDMLDKIKSHRTPPRRDDDIYFERDPWNKFGGISSGIVMAWFWYRDDVILDKANIGEILQAYKEIVENEQE